MKKINNDSYIYILLQVVLIILIDSLYNYTFNIFNTNINYSILLLPFIFYITNYIYKKYEYKIAIKSIFISILSLLIYNIIMTFAFNSIFDIYSVLGDVCSYLISLFICLKLNSYFDKNFKFSIILLFLRYIFSILIYHIVYVFISLDKIELYDIWLYYIIVFIIQILLCIPIVFMDYKLLNKNN